MKEIAIKLNLVQFTSVSLKAETFDTALTNVPDIKTNVGLGVAFSETDEVSFAVIFDVEICTPDNLFNLNVKATAHFKTNNPIDEEFKLSSFAKISAPAIAFPYIRAFISNLTLGAGYNPIVLPSYNFITPPENLNIN